MRINWHKQWDKKLIAEISKRKITGFHRFKHCIDSVKNKPELCLKKNKCIIGLLINEINKHGRKKASR